MNPELARMVAKLKTLRADVDRICGDIMRLERKIIEALLEEMA